MNPFPPRRTGRPLRAGRLAAAAVLTLGLTLGATACTGEANPTSTVSQRDVAPGTGVWDASEVHEIAVTFDDADYAAMIEAYTDSDTKEWITADVTIDGTTYRDAGLRLKGNSSLRGVSASSKAEELPWLIRLDKFVDGQAVSGDDGEWTEFVVRSNSTTSALNEAVALDLLREAGLASQQAVHSTFSVNGSEAQLRLVVQNLDEAWEAENFATTGWLYKSEAEGDWTYRGDDAESYVDVFDQETGEDDVAPLAAYLKFVNEADDDTFVADLDEEMDVEAFATYLAFQELIDNFDDIDGPGNNSYLRWDAENERFTVVAWDHNLAFGGRPGGAGGPGGMGGERGERPEGMPEMPEGFEPPDDFDPGQRPQGMPEGMPEDFDPEQRPERADGEGAAGGRGAGGPGAGGRGPGGGNVLSERFTKTDEFAALVEEAKSDLQASLYDSGRAAELLDARVATLTEQASGLIDTKTSTSEADAIRSYFTRS